ncbi:MAG: ribosome maturation factor RimM [Myxococcota bacterium]|nr:ribosome maturation factor RimM [Myxococcota bacterium]
MARQKRKSSAAREGELSFGQVVGSFGVKGELRVHLHNRSSTLLHSGAQVVLASPGGERRTVQLRTRPGAKGRVLARITGVETPEAAVAFLDWEILVPEDLLPPLREGEFYHRDILRSAVEDTTGRDLGKVIEIHDNGPVEIWVLELPSGEQAYFPVLLDKLVEVDPKARRIVLAEGSIACG